MTIYYVSTTGSNSASGSIDAPFASLAYAHARAQPGDTIYLRGGVYKVSTGIQLTNDGVEGKPITIESYPGEKAVLDGSGMTSGGYYSGWVLDLSSVNWNHIRNLEIRGGAEGGLVVEGSSNYNILESLDIHHNGRLSQWEGKGVSVYGSSAFNTLRNIDSHHNQDLNKSNADGFQIATTGAGNVLDGNRAWANSDDGFDFFNVQNGTTAGALTVTNNWSWGNGWALDGSAGGDGNGFKLGGVRANSGTLAGAHTVEGNVAWGNRQNGFDENSGNGGVQHLTLHNNTAYNNGAYNYVFVVEAGHIFQNNISYGTGQVRITGTHDHNSWDSAVTLTAADFASLDAASPDFLHLASGSDLIDAGTNVGRPYSGLSADLGAFEFGGTTTPPPDGGDTGGGTTEPPPPPPALNPVDGTSGNDTLTGTSGNDLIDGKAGYDAMYGKGGDDTYVVDHDWDGAFENAGEGTDTVRASVNFTLPTNVENLTLTGSSALNGTGNAVANEIRGNDAANVLNGRAGADVLWGNGGADRFVFSTLSEARGDTVMDFTHGTDRLDFSGIDANTSRRGDQAFTWDGYSSGGSNGHIWAVEANDGFTHVYARAGGVTTEVLLKGHGLHLTSGDFYL